MSWKVRLLLSFVLFLLGSGISGFAQVELQVLSPPQTATPGDFVTIAFEVTNTGPSPDTFEFSVDVPEGLMPILAISPLTLDPGASQTIFLTIAVLPQAAAGENTVTLRATSTHDPAIAASATAIIEVLQAPGVDVLPPPDREVELGEVVELEFHVINWGNTLDHYALLASSRRGFPLAVQPEELELLPGEKRAVIVQVTVPADATPGRDQITLLARSTIFGVEASATVQLTILPPPPEAVGGTLALEVPTTLAFTLTGTPPTPFTFLQTLSGSTTFGEASEIAYRVQIANLLELRALRFYLERERFGVTIGDLALDFSPLVELRGRGMRGTTKAGPESPSQATLAAAIDADGQLAVGGQARLDLQGWVPGLSTRFRPALQEILASATLNVLAFPSLNFVIERALSRDATTADSAWLLLSRLRLGSLLLTSEFVRAGSDFLGARRDEEGMLFTQSLLLQGIALQSRFHWKRDNVSQDPAKPTTVEVRVNAAARIPLNPLPTLSLQIDFRSRSNLVPPVLTDLQDFRVGVRLAQTIGPLTLSATFDHKHSQDFIAGTDLERALWRSDADLRLDPLLTLFRIELVTRRDLLAGVVLERAVNTLISARLRYPHIDLSFSVERVPALTEFTAALEIELGRFTAAVEQSLRVEDGGALDFASTLSTSLLFDLPIPFIRTKGRVEGFVFLDENGDGVREPDEPGVSDLIISLDGVQVRTDGEGTGFYRSPPLQPGTYTLQIENLPATLISATPLPLEITLKEGEVLRLDLPLSRVAAIRGVVFNDENGNGQREEGEEGLANVQLFAVGPDGEEHRVVTGARGTFQFAGLTPGTWTVILDVTTLPAYFELTTPREVTVQLGSGETVEVNFGAREVLPGVKFSPTADFTFEPSRPRAGEPVTFDASPSFDADGQIVKYEWDFDGDGRTDAEGITVTFTFEAPGDFAVTLTVTDNDGLTGTKIRTITVLPP